MNNNILIFKEDRPKIEDSDSSFMIAKDLRHPIVEKINTEEKYQD